MSASNGLALRSRALAFAALALAAIAFQPVRADTLAGTLTIVGSDTLSTLVLRWIDAFRAQHRDALIQLQTPGSASAPIALLEGAADIGAMSRAMNAQELKAFADRYGYAPTGVVVARDAIVVFVHPDNPLTEITREEVDAIYSASPLCGAPRAITRWSELGIDAALPLSKRAILANGRNSASGTSEFFRSIALCGGAYRADVVAWPGHGATVAAVAANPEAIGYAGIGAVNGLVKPLAIAASRGAPAVAPVMENVMNGDYALARPLYFYVNQPPGRAAAALPAAFLAYALSEEAQAEVRREGFLPAASNETDAQTPIRATIPSP